MHGISFVVVDICFQFQLIVFQLNEKPGTQGLEPTEFGFMMKPHKKLFQETPG